MNAHKYFVTGGISHPHDCAASAPMLDDGFVSSVVDAFLDYESIEDIWMSQEDATRESIEDAIRIGLRRATKNRKGLK